MERGNVLGYDLSVVVLAPHTEVDGTARVDGVAAVVAGDGRLRGVHERPSAYPRASLPRGQA